MIESGTGPLSTINFLELPADEAEPLDLPARATVGQRSMIYAVGIHPEQPRSVNGECHTAFLAHAESHSRRQASMQRQHHAGKLGANMPCLLVRLAPLLPEELQPCILRRRN